MAVARRVFVGLAWLFVLGVVIQFFLAGLGTLGGGDFDAHNAFGYSALYFFPILILVAAYVSKSPRPLLIMTVVLVAVVLAQPVWVTGFRGDFLGAFHVLGAAVILMLAHAVARRATELSRGGTTEA